MTSHDGAGEPGRARVPKPGLRSGRRVVVAAVTWVALAVLAWSLASLHDDGLAGLVADVIITASTPRGAFGLLLVAFVLRPVTLLPSTVLTALAGFLLGPGLGVAVALVAVTATSLVPYGVARWVRGRRLRPPKQGWRSALARHPFSAVLAARLMMLPGDLVNVSAGVLRVPLLPFATATAVGGSPGILAGVLAGASLRGSRFALDALHLDLRLLLWAAALLVVSLLVSLLLRRRAVAPV